MFTLITSVCFAQANLGKPPPGSKIDKGHNLTRGLIGWWLFNEGAGNRVYDLSGFNRHGTLTNMDPSTDWVGSVFGGAIDLKAGDDFIDLGSEAFLDAGIPHTITWLVYIDALTEEFPAVGNFVTSGGQEFEIFYNAGAFSDVSWGSSSPTWDTKKADFPPSVSVTGEWHLGTITYDGIDPLANSSFKFYINGISPTVSDTSGFGTQSAANRIGNLPSTSTSNWDGRFAEFRIYNRELSPAEVKQLFEQPFIGIVKRDTYRLFVEAVAAERRIMMIH